MGAKERGLSRWQHWALTSLLFVEAVARAVAERFKAEVPTAFDGDGVAYLQTVYRDPSVPLELRLNAAAKAARFERPTLAAVAVQQTPNPRIDVSMLSREERETMAKLLRRIMGRASRAAIGRP